ncbi:von Willebrand factor A domain-containing protein 2-like [Crassostrea angulata]|uniref:von Willebrand factor A domain-containing protein 2-like n=1 Tax=Magallana angulata TaxID=2784310 RepID=UPI0022B1288C|nr:von Willebrand factor A domain-containing protein 2-like [Crassostrea angulata]
MLTIATVITAALFSGVTCHKGHHYLPGEVSHQQSASFLLDREKRAIDCFNEYVCERNIPYCQSQSELVRETYCSRHNCPSGLTCYLSVPCPVHYTANCIADPCASFPCGHGGTCTKISDTTFSCFCLSGYDPATNCATEINECDSNPCQNGATCVDELNRYSCNCIPGYMGTHCEIDIDECQSSPCQNGGSCNDLVNRFECTCSGRYNGTVCEKDCRPGPADIVFVVDSSESADFTRSLDFVSNIIQNLSIGPNDFQIAMITFSWNATLEFAFDEYSNNQSLIDAVNGVAPEYGPTYLTEALTLAEQISSGTANGRRPSVPCYVVILTDGLAADVQGYVTQARLMQWRGVRMMGVGIGSSVSHTDLITLSSNIDDVFFPDNDDMLNTILRETSHQDCNDCILRKDSDVMFLVDITQTGQVLASVSRTMREISSFFSLNMNETRIGLMTYASNVTNQFSLTTHTDHSTLYPALSKFPQIDEESDIIYTLRYVRDFGFATSNGGRLDSRKIVVMYSSGNWSDLGTLQSEFKSLMTEGYRLFNVITSYDEAKVNSFICHFIPTYGTINAATTDSKSALKTLAAEATYGICDKDVFIKRAI